MQEYTPFDAYIKKLLAYGDEHMLLPPEDIIEELGIDPYREHKEALELFASLPDADKQKLLEDAWEYPKNQSEAGYLHSDILMQDWWDRLPFMEGVDSFGVYQCIILALAMAIEMELNELPLGWSRHIQKSFVLKKIKDAFSTPEPTEYNPTPGETNHAASDN